MYDRGDSVVGAEHTKPPRVNASCSIDAVAAVDVHSVNTAVAAHSRATLSRIGIDLVPQHVGGHLLDEGGVWGQEPGVWGPLVRCPPSIDARSNRNSFKILDSSI